MRKIKNYLPKDLEGVIDEDDFNKVFRYLESTFRISRSWCIDFHSELLTQKREVNSIQFFVKYLIENIEPSIKHLLKRNDETIIEILRYLMKEKIQEKFRSKMTITHKKKLNS